MRYYFKLAWISFKQTPLLSSLIVVTIAVGIAATMTTYTINYMMNQEPVPGKADSLFLVQLNSWGPQKAYYSQGDEERVPPYLTFQDMQNLWRANRAESHIPVSGYRDQLKLPTQPDSEAKTALVRSTSRDFFSAFNAPIKFGSAWSEDADLQGERVAVISADTNQRLFNGENSVGQHITLGALEYRIIGVMDNWPILPRFYGEAMHAFRKPRDVFIPFETQVRNALWSSNLQPFECWQDPQDSSFEALLASECVWVYFWVELKDASQRRAYEEFLYTYVQEQRALGRFQRKILNKLSTPGEYLADREAISDDNLVALGLSLCFLLLCLLNSTNLMMAKFHGKASEIGLRRAVGASKQQIFVQFSVETVLMGLFGGALGLLLAQLGLTLCSRVYQHLSSDLMHMDMYILVMTPLVAVSVSVLFGLFPVFRASRIEPASQLNGV
ncbi:ABC transporter permease [Pseudoalteromonas sp. DL2-H2.2]|uniref:ABC transporter permease n=1 Tax=Pseudoalteromonas sp. DL2-H2.2 TaxID=2908889 RepID=UPI001F38E413|nr:ABC transporter permease [Pseudoalteromonas sp. DL2-H2.2]MCF2910684.1 ABC transporter permease [Pseudoalteromonas sp. DL2-H2.2]